MDIDRFIRTNQPVWRRLDELSSRAGRGFKRLSPEELEELVRLYQRVATHLSYANTHFADPALTQSLSRLTARAGSLIYGTRARTLRAVSRFFAETFPAAVWHSRWFVGAAAAIFLLPAVAVAAWVANSPAAFEATAPAAVREAYLSEGFEEYYSSQPSSLFASQVTTNNVQVGIVAFAGGIFFCLLTVVVLLLNGANVGLVAGLFAAVGRQPFFWGLILPHGLLEITAVFVAAAAGLRLGWTLIEPGDRRRAEALTEEGRRAIVIVVGLILVFAVAGLIEGFVTGAPWPTWIRVGIGVAAEAVFLTYVWVLGRAAAARGLTGSLGESDPAGWIRT